MDFSCQLLPFVSNEKLLLNVRNVIDSATRASTEIEKGFFKNVIDPFSALFDASFQGLSLTQWLEQEKARQAQKTMQNALGAFHQGILGSMPGWEDLGTGNVVDLRNRNKRIIAEIKNKFNTTKGNHKMHIYDDLLESLAKQESNDFTAYYVEIIPPNKKKYNATFTPSDNNTKERRPTNERIRVIDGYSFYDLASGEKDTLIRLYIILPQIIHHLLERPEEMFIDAPEFIDLFHLAYQ